MDVVVSSCAPYPSQRHLQDFNPAGGRLLQCGVLSCSTHIQLKISSLATRTFGICTSNLLPSDPDREESKYIFEKRDRQPIHLKCRGHTARKAILLGARVDGIMPMARVRRCGCYQKAVSAHVQICGSNPCLSDSDRHEWLHTFENLNNPLD